MLQKETLCSNVTIEFVGVWDTVSSIATGLRSVTFGSKDAIRTFRHALSLDERRVKFKPSLYLDFMPVPNEELYFGRRGGNSRKTDVLEVWFVGTHAGACVFPRCHSPLFTLGICIDVGGGNIVQPPSLARIPLRWMVRQCVLANTGIMFHVDGLLRLGLNPDTLYPLVVPSTPDSTQIDLQDVQSPSFDELKLRKFWWILEWLPMRELNRNGDGTWYTRTVCVDHCASSFTLSF